MISKGSDFLDVQKENLKFHSYNSAVLAEDTFNGNTHAHSSIENKTTIHNFFPK